MPTRSRPIALVFGLCSATFFPAGCGSGPYNFGRDYSPLRAEREHYDATEQQVSFEDVQRDPNGFANVEVGWFGVVTSMGDSSDGRTRLTLSLRAHQARHLCGTEQSSSCRVTVSARSMGTFVIEVALSADQKVGQDPVGIGSLLKVYGTPTSEHDDQATPIVKVAYFRHFPRDTYVTTAQRSIMRR